jgi:hypothetical protein
MLLVVRRSIVPAWLCSIAFAAAVQGADGQPAEDAADAAPEAMAPAVAASPVEALRREVPRWHPRVNMAGCGRAYRVFLTHASESDLDVRDTLAAPRVDVQNLDFNETPLRAVIEQIEESFKVPIVIDWPALTDAGIDIDAGTATAKIPPNLSLRQVLRLVLGDSGLTWIAADGVLHVTTREVAQERPLIIIYPVPRGFGTGQSSDVQSTIDLIQSTVSPETWDTNGGHGSIRPVDVAGAALLVVSQTGKVHDEIERLMRGLHETLLADFARGKPVLRVHSVRDAADREQFADTLAGLCNDSLGDVGDPNAKVQIVGETLLVQSRSPEFHALAGQLIAAVEGVPVAAGVGPPTP